MTVPRVFQLPKQTALNVGVVASGAKAYFFKAGTTTPQATYTTSALTTQHAHPVVADAAGLFPTIYLDDELQYRVQIKDSGDVLIYDQDEINDPNNRAPFYEQTQAESDAGVTPVSYQYAENNVFRRMTNAQIADIRSFTGSIDVTTALQEAINFAAAAGFKKVRFPAGKYKFSTLYLYYDATNNPNYPQDNQRQGRLKLVGEGMMDVAAYNNSTGFGTWLASTNTTSPAIKAEDNSSPYPVRNVELLDMTVSADSSDFVASFKGVSTMCRFDRVFIAQDNASGSGLQLEDHWTSSHRDLYIFCAPETGTGIGLRVRNVALSSGLPVFKHVTVRGWNGVGGKGWEVGHPTYGSGNNINTVRLTACQAAKCETGMTVGHGVSSAELDSLHVENCTKLGLYIAQFANNVRVTGYFSNPDATVADIQVGDSTLSGAAREYRNVTLENIDLKNINAVGVLVDLIGSNTRGLRLSNINFSAAAAGVGTGIQLTSAADKHGVLIETPLFDADLANEIVNLSGADALIGPDQFYIGRTLELARVTVASATDIPWSSRGNLWRVSGTTNINTIAAPPNGNGFLYLYFTGALTVQDEATAGGNIALAGGADLAVNSDDVLTLIWDDSQSKWLQVAYSSN